jgi:Ca2+-binding RTX toxin-like protein
MRIKGSGKNDSLHGSESSDVLDGGRGNDFLDGHGGNDTLTGGAGGDVFILRPGGGADVVTDFSSAEGDRVLLDYGAFPDEMFVGSLRDGLSWTTDSGATCWIEAIDFNGDGLTDTMIQMNTDCIVLLSCQPMDLTGQMLLGG